MQKYIELLRKPMQVKPEVCGPLVRKVVPPHLMYIV